MLVAPEWKPRPAEWSHLAPKVTFLLVPRTEAGAPDQAPFRGHCLPERHKPAEARDLGAGHALTWRRFGHRLKPSNIDNSWWN